MMTRAEVSKHRQHLHKLIDEIHKLSSQCAYPDTLIRGTPGEVFRRCGQKKCKCASEDGKRHGPYQVIHIYEKKKQRQVALRRNQNELWQKAKNYQKQIKTLSELKKACKVLTETVQAILNQRLEKFP